MRVRRVQRGKRRLLSCKLYCCLSLVVYLFVQLACRGLFQTAEQPVLLTSRMMKPPTTQPRKMRSKLSVPHKKSWINSKHQLFDRAMCFSANLTRTAQLLRKQRKSGVPLQLPRPIINLGLPKVGSTTLAQFFECGGLRSNHWKIATENATNGGVHVGQCMHGASTVGRLPLGYCEEQAKVTDKFDAWLQMDYILKGECYFPQSDGHDSVDVTPGGRLVLESG